jgi:hypothetical protein
MTSDVDLHFKDKLLLPWEMALTNFKTVDYMIVSF